MLKDLDKMRADFAAKLAAAERENAIHAVLPVPPKRVMLQGQSAPWVSYEVATLAEALAIKDQYTLLPWVIAKGTFTTLGLREDIDRSKNTYTAFAEILDGTPFFECQRGVGFGGNEMVFFTEIACQKLHIIVDIKYLPFGPSLIYIDRNARRDGKKYRKDYSSVLGADTLQWGYGDDCIKATYWFRDPASFDLCMEQYVSDDKTA